MFECHITCKVAFVNELEINNLYKLAEEFNWKTSFIEGDPLLGSDTFFYLTSYHEDLQVLKLRMHEMSDRVGKLVIRKKIEQIVYDTKTGLI